MRRIRTGLILLMIATAAASPALADRGRGGAERSFAGFEVSRATAVDIARAQGMRDVLKVEARRGVWRVEGRDGSGQRLIVEVDGFSGAVVRVERSGR
ncbi:MAG: PepSY domain-containing protein [Hyphomonas sp.]